MLLWYVIGYVYSKMYSKLILHNKNIIFCTNLRNISAVTCITNNIYPKGCDRLLLTKQLKSNHLMSSLSKESVTTNTSLTNKEKLKKAVAEYGTTVIVFHVAISLISLGLCYLLVINGLDVEKVLDKLHLSQEIIDKIPKGKGVGYFVIAYAFNKVFAPARILITLSCTPFIVKYLRRIGFLKLPRK